MNIGLLEQRISLTQNFLPYLLLLVSGIGWGATFSLAKISTAAGGHPLGIALWQGLIGGFTLLAWYGLKSRWPALDRQNIRRYFIIGLLGTALPSTLYFYAARQLPAGILSITVALVPILTYAAALVIGSEQFSARRIIGVILGFAGIAMLTRPEALPDPSMLIWLALAIGCAVSYTVENLYVEQMPAVRGGTGLLLTGSLLAAAVMLLPVVIASNNFVPLNWPPGPLEYAVVAMAFISATAYLMFLWLIKNAGAVFASMMGYVITIAGVGWGIWLFEEQHSLLIWLVLVIMLAGMGMVKPRNRSLPTAPIPHLPASNADADNR